MLEPLTTGNKRVQYFWAETSLVVLQGRVGSVPVVSRGPSKDHTVKLAQLTDVGLYRLYSSRALTSTCQVTVLKRQKYNVECFPLAMERKHPQYSVEFTCWRKVIMTFLFTFAVLELEPVGYSWRKRSFTVLLIMGRTRRYSKSSSTRAQRTRGTFGLKTSLCKLCNALYEGLMCSHDITSFDELTPVLWLKPFYSLHHLNGWKLGHIYLKTNSSLKTSSCSDLLC